MAIRLSIRRNAILLSNGGSLDGATIIKSISIGIGNHAIATSSISIFKPSTAGIGSLSLNLTTNHSSSTFISSFRHSSTDFPFAQTPLKPGISANHVPSYSFRYSAFSMALLKYSFFIY